MVFNHKPSILGPIVMVFAIMTFCLAGEVYSQEETGEYEVCIQNASRLAFYRHGFFGDPKTDITVKWRVLLQEKEQEINTFKKYTVSYSEDPSFPDVKAFSTTVSADIAEFKDLDARVTYFFKVEAFNSNDINAKPAAESEIYESEGKDISNDLTQFSPAYLTLSLLNSLWDFDGAIKALEKASFMGRLAFEVIFLFLYIGLIAGFFKTHLILRATQVFFVNKKINDKDECDKIPDLVTYYGLPHEMITTVTQLAKERLTRAYYYGHKRIGRLETLCWWERLVKKRRTGDDDDKLFKDIPTFKILKAISHKFEERSELKEALEVQIAAEEEDLRKRSFIDILWGLGVTAPLVGLFGTVTGISQSFKVISVSSPDDINLMKNLSGGIFEALFTTVCGLTVGIIFMLAFYYYNYKLDRIHAIWVTFAASYLDIYSRRLNNISASTSPTATPPSPSSPSSPAPPSTTPPPPPPATGN